MNFDEIIIFGANSSIYSYLKMDFENWFDQITYINRSYKTDFKVRSTDRYFEFSNYSEEADFNFLLKTLNISNRRVLILNFIGVFGEIETANKIDSILFFETFKSNLDPVFRIANLFNQVAEKSI